MYLKDSVKETNKFHIYETEEITRIFAKPVTRQNISSCSVLSPEIVMHDTFNAILWTSADICVVVHDDLGWKNRTTRYILPHHWLYEWFLSAANIRRYMRRAWRSRVKEPNNTL